MQIINKSYEIIYDGKNIHIINYLKVNNITSYVIEVYLNNNIVSIIGNNLMINKMNEKELLLSGDINEIKFNKKDKD